MTILKRFTEKLTSRRPKYPRGIAGCRAYAIGDIHGRLDLLEQLLEQIEADDRARRPMKTFMIFLGDLIDRGPASAGVVERLRTYDREGVKSVFLSGNHEEILLRILSGDGSLLTNWLRFGGAECAQSYGLDPELLAGIEINAAIEQLRAKIPASHVRFLKGFSDTFRFGDYLFVHAGIRPGLSIDEQDRADLRWIREPFLNDASEHGFVVVHGHTIVDQVEERPNRIGIDTGAYRSGRLTALAIQDDARWMLGTS